MKTRTLLYALVLIQINKSQRLDILETTTGNSCPLERTCATRNSCPYWQEKNVELRTLARGPARKELINQFKSAICNKEKEGLCCCPESQCDSIESCAHWSGKQQKLKELRPRSQQYKDLKNEIVSAICNKERKAVCCPIIKITERIHSINNSPSYIPAEGECGLNPHKVPSKVSSILL